MTKTTYTAFGVTRTSDAAYTHAAKHYVGVTFHKTEEAARKSGGQVMPTTVVAGPVPKAKSWPAIECGRCGKMHTTLKCDGCGF